MEQSVERSQAEGWPEGRVVAIGASAGGLEALESLFSSMAPSIELSFVVIQHLSPDHRSMMTELLTRRTQMRVMPARHGEVPEANTVYLNSPGELLGIAGGRFTVTELPAGHRVLPIDYFFTSLAAAKCEGAVAIVLSGTGSDGARGAAEVRRLGGRVIVQSPESAAFDGMPRACIAAAKPDFSGSPEEIADYLGSCSLGDGADDRSLNLSDATLATILVEVARESGTDFSEYRKNSLRRRVERRVLRFELKSGDEYLAMLRANPEEARSLAEDFLIGVTSFFRDPEAFVELERQVIRALIQDAPPNSEVRVWSVACSTGEEAYSVALMFAYWLDKLDKELDVKIFASDVNAKSIQFAARGVYPERALLEIPEQYRYLVSEPADGHFAIPPWIRSMVVFAAHNLLVDPPFAKTDLVLCRNLLIYFEMSLQARALETFAFSVRPDGVLFLGSSESVGAHSNVFEPLATHARLFRCQHFAKRAPPARPHGRNGILSAYSRGAMNARIVETLAEALAARVGPAGVAVGSNLEPLHFFGDVTPYLSVSRGVPSLNLIKLARAGFGATLAAAVSRARQSGREFSYLSSSGEGEALRSIKLTLIPLPGATPSSDMTLVFFDEVHEAKGEAHAPAMEELSAQERSHDLEQELLHTRESLQGIVEELEVANEELQSTNEELLSSNEELQSTNEELQAVNEELYTVNTEYMAKVRELDQSTSDLTNVLESADIALVLLDKSLLVRRFTSLAGSILGIRQADLGRSLSELALGGAAGALVEAARQVNADDRERACEIAVGRKRLTARLSPYRNSLRESDGAVIVLGQ